MKENSNPFYDSKFLVIIQGMNRQPKLSLVELPYDVLIELRAEIDCILKNTGMSNCDKLENSKQMPIKVTHEATLYKSCTCPSCGNVVDEFVKFNDVKHRVIVPFCRFCGQALDWSNE